MSVNRAELFYLLRQHIRLVTVTFDILFVVNDFRDDGRVAVVKERGLLVITPIKDRNHHDDKKITNNTTLNL